MGLKQAARSTSALFHFRLTSESYKKTKSGNQTKKDNFLKIEEEKKKKKGKDELWENGANEKLQNQNKKKKTNKPETKTKKIVICISTRGNKHTRS